MKIIKLGIKINKEKIAFFALSQGCNPRGIEHILMRIYSFISSTSFTYVVTFIQDNHCWIKISP